MVKLLILPLVFVAALEGAGGAAVLVHGHRGARAARPENTMAAFEYAIQAGVDVLELDLSVTRDRVLVVSHDPVLKAPVCRGNRAEATIFELTLEEVKQWDCGSVRNPAFASQQPVPEARVPALSEVLALAPRGAFQFNIETKIDPRFPTLTPAPQEFARLVLAEIRKFHLESRVMVQSFDFRTLHEMHKLDPAIRTVALYAGPPKSLVEIAREAGTKIVSPEHRLVTRQAVAEAHAAGLRVVPWTANSPADWARLIEAGVDEIITDDPAALIAYLKAHGK